MRYYSRANNAVCSVVYCSARSLVGSEVPCPLLRSGHILLSRSAILSGDATAGRRYHVTSGRGTPVTLQTSTTTSPSCTVVSSDDSSSMIVAGTASHTHRPSSMWQPRTHWRTTARHSSTDRRWTTRQDMDYCELQRRNCQTNCGPATQSGRTLWNTYDNLQYTGWRTKTYNMHVSCKSSKRTV